MLTSGLTVLSNPSHDEKVVHKTLPYTKGFGVDVVQHSGFKLRSPFTFSTLLPKSLVHPDVMSASLQDPISAEVGICGAWEFAIPLLLMQKGGAYNFGPNLEILQAKDYGLYTELICSTSEPFTQAKFTPPPSWEEMVITYSELNEERKTVCLVSYFHSCMESLLHCFTYSKYNPILSVNSRRIKYGDWIYDPHILNETQPLQHFWFEPDGLHVYFDTPSRSMFANLE